jgi:hypothetical protein
MSDFPYSPDYRAGAVSADSTALWPAFAKVRAGHTVILGSLKPRPELPIYCNPVAIFFAVWILMLTCLDVHVSYVIYPYLATPFSICAVSTVSLLLGYFAFTAAAAPAGAQDAPLSYLLDVTTLWRLNLLFCFLALPIIAFNWITAGPPPAIGDPSSYLTYGNFKQVLFPLLTCIAVNSTLDPSRFRRYAFISFALGVIAVYVARGVLLLTFLQMFFLFSLRSGMSKKKQYLLCLGAFAFAVAGMTVIGNLRTAHDIFIDFLQIRDQYSDWPMAWLWLVSYVSIPFSNLCWMVAHPSAHGPTLAFLYPLLPTFMAPSEPYADLYGSMNIIDNASTYLQTYALDFSYLGIYFANLLLGLGCGWCVVRAYPKRILTLSIFLTSISLIFFTDMFLLLSIVIQTLIQCYVQRRCFQWNA